MALEFTPQDTAFLSNLKKQGVPAEEAFKRLDTVKAKMAGSPMTPSTPSVPPTPIGKAALGGAIDKVGEEIKGVADAGVSAVQAVTADPKGAVLGAIGNVAKDAGQSLVVNPITAAWKTAAAIPDTGRTMWNLLTGQGEYSDETKKEARSYAESLLNTGLTDDEVIAKTSEKYPDIMSAQKLKEAGDSSRKSLEGVASYIPTPLHQGAVGFEKETTKSLDEGIPLEEALGRGSVAGATGATMMKLVNKFFTAKPKEGPTGIDKVKAELSGLSKQDVAALTRESGISEDRAMQLLNSAKEAAADRSKKAPMDLTGERLSKTQTEIESRADAVGKQIGQEAKALKGKNVPQIDTTPTRTALQDRLRDLNVKVKQDGTLDFAKSDIAGLAADQALIQDVWSFAQKPFVPLRDTLAKIRNLRNKIYTGSAAGDLSVSKAVAEIGREELRKSLFGVRGKLGDLSKQFAELEELATEFVKKTKDGIRTPELLRRLFSSAGSEAKDFLGKVETVAEKYGIDSGKKLFNEADIALTAERAAGVERNTSLMGQVKEGLQPTKSTLSKIIGFAGNKIVGTPEKNFVELFKKAAGNANPKSRIEKIMGEFAKTPMGKEFINLLETGSLTKPKE